MTDCVSLRDKFHEKLAVQTFESSVSAIAINEKNIIAVGLESGQLIIAKFNEGEVEGKDEVEREEG